MLLGSSPDYQDGKAAVSSIKQAGAVIFLSVLACLCVGCAGISSSAGNQSSASNNSNFKVSLSPATATISSGTQRQFAATVTSTGRELVGGTSTEIVWHASAGTISSGGLFTAPTVTSSTTVTVTATSVADEGAVAVSEVTIVPSTKIVVNLSRRGNGVSRRQATIFRDADLHQQHGRHLAGERGNNFEQRSVHRAIVHHIEQSDGDRHERC